jgi:hypothetical protein
MLQVSRNTWTYYRFQRRVLRLKRLSLFLNVKIVSIVPFHLGITTLVNRTQVTQSGSHACETSMFFPHFVEYSVRGPSAVKEGGGGLGCF